MIGSNIVGDFVGNALVDTGKFIDNAMNFAGDVVGNVFGIVDDVGDCTKKVISVATNAIVDVGTTIANEAVSLWNGLFS